MRRLDSLYTARPLLGSRRIVDDLAKEGRFINRKRVQRLMREEGLRSKVPARFKQTTDSDHADPVAANLLDRDFTAAAPNQRWVGDTTEFVIGEGAKLYLAAILDLYSRFVVGWAVSAVNDRRLTLKALEMAVRRRCPEPGLLHHSDRGSQGGFNRSTQHWVVRRIVGTGLGLRLVSSNQASSAVWY